MADRREPNGHGDRKLIDIGEGYFAEQVSLGTTGDAAVAATATPGTVGHGRKVVAAAGTDEALAASTTIKSVIITAETDNTGLIVVGGTGVDGTLATRTGTPLNAGESLALDIDNLADVFIDATVTGDGVTYTYTV